MAGPDRRGVLEPARPSRVEGVQRRHAAPAVGEGVVDPGVPDQFQPADGQPDVDHDGVGAGVRGEPVQQTAGKVLRGADAGQCPGRTTEGVGLLDGHRLRPGQGRGPR
ncbi:hypothetical protein [Streptomyces antibioticus]|uniref:hypothetical protein n=1 Tax=Streptomyces antibioticus TaxID=1890 RepID=UPI003F4D53DA